MDSIEYWNLLHAAHMYLVPGLIDHCNDKLSEFMTTLNDNDELIAHVNRASQLYIYEDISKAGVVAIKERLKEIILTESWLTLQEAVVLELVADINLKVLLLLLLLLQQFELSGDRGGDVRRHGQVVPRQHRHRGRGCHEVPAEVL